MPSITDTRRYEFIAEHIPGCNVSVCRHRTEASCRGPTGATRSSRGGFATRPLRTSNASFGGVWLVLVCVP